MQIGGWEFCETFETIKGSSGEQIRRDMLMDMDIGFSIDSASPRAPAQWASLGHQYHHSALLAPIFIQIVPGGRNLPRYIARKIPT